MLDYLEVKKFHARHLAANADGTGKVEDAFYETIKFVYSHAVRDALSLGKLDIDKLVADGVIPSWIVGIDKRKGTA